MKVRLTAKGFNQNCGTIAESTIVTSVRNDDNGYVIGKLLYTFEQSGFIFETQSVYTDYVRNLQRLDKDKVTNRFLPIVNNRYGQVKMTISVAHN